MYKYVIIFERHAQAGRNMILLEPLTNISHLDREEGFLRQWDLSCDLGEKKKKNDREVMRKNSAEVNEEEVLMSEQPLKNPCIRHPHARRSSGCETNESKGEKQVLGLQHSQA